MTNLPEPGCYIDSHHGHYAIPETIRIAERYGRRLDEKTAGILARYDAESHREDYPHEWVIEESDAAIQWLNDHVAVDGHVWEWNEGDFGLYPLEADDEDSAVDAP